MTTPNLPEGWEELLAGYALDELNPEPTDLTPEETEQIQQLLTAHPHLQAEAAALQAAIALLPYALPETEPPPRLRDAILAAAEQQRPAVESDRPPVAPQRARRRWGWQPVAGAAAALVAALLLADNLRLRQQTQTAAAMLEALQQPDTLVYALEGTEAAAAASGRVVVSPQQRSIWVAVHNLPALPEGQAYRLWALADPSAPTYCGQFNSTAGSNEGTVRWEAPADACRSPVPQMLITAESATAPPVPAGELVLRSTATL